VEFHGGQKPDGGVGIEKSKNCSQSDDEKLPYQRSLSTKDETPGNGIEINYICSFINV
jgi:hypothetical protein